MRGVAMVAAVIVSALGLAFHTVREFGWSALWNPASGMIPVLAVQVALLVAWLRADRPARGLAKALLAMGVIQLVGGAIISVLPLPILPYAPDQSLQHYISHVGYGIAQLPLIWVTLRALAVPVPLPVPQGR
jgi:hypothetical protein